MMLNLEIVSLEHKIVWIFFLVELVLIALLVLGSYGTKIWFIIKHAIKKKKAREIKAYFQKKNINLLPPHIKTLDVIFFELRTSSVLSDQEKKEFVKRYILKQTRPFIRTKNYIKRFYLLESYNYCITAEDESNLIQLIKDNRPIISINASRLSNVLITPAIYQAILEKLTTVEWALQKLYIAQLPKNDVLLNVIKDNLINTESNALKKLYYDIVYSCGPRDDFYDLAKLDIENSDKECQLAAIRVFAQSAPEEAKNKLFSLLKNNDWLIRNAAIQSLIRINIPESLEHLAQCLNDENYWVRVNATSGLLNLGEEGRLMVTQYKASSEASVQSLASYFLVIPKMKEQL